LANQEDESSPPPASQCQTAHHSAPKQAIATMGWTVLPHVPHSSDLAPSNFHLFWPCEGCTPRMLFYRQLSCNAGCVELQHFSEEFYVTCIEYLMQRWIKCADSEGECGKIISTF